MPVRNLDFDASGYRGPRVAFLPHAGREVASVRLRALIPSAELARVGRPSELFRPRRSETYDVVVFQKAYEPRHLELAEQLRSQGKRIVFDLCDNHVYALRERNELARLHALERMLDLADVVTVSTPALASTLDRPSMVVDDAVEYRVPNEPAPPKQRRRARRHPDTLRLVWFGNAGSDRPAYGVRDLATIIGPLNAVHAQHPISLLAITSSRRLVERHTQSARFPVRYLRWRRSSFPKQFRGNDICVLPATANPFTVCKTSNRVVTSLVLGLPIVADRLPSYEEFESAILLGDWESNILTYTDARRAREDVTRGREIAARRFNAKSLVERWEMVLRSACRV